MWESVPNLEVERLEQGASHQSTREDGQCLSYAGGRRSSQPLKAEVVSGVAEGLTTRWIHSQEHVVGQPDRLSRGCIHEIESLLKLNLVSVEVTGQEVLWWSCLSLSTAIELGDC